MIILIPTYPLVPCPSFIHSLTSPPLPISCPLGPICDVCSCINHFPLHKETPLMRSDSSTSYTEIQFRGKFDTMSICQGITVGSLPRPVNFPIVHALLVYSTRYVFPPLVQALNPSREMLVTFITYVPLLPWTIQDMSCHSSICSSGLQFIMFAVA